MCCSGDSTAKQTEAAQAAFTNTLSGAFRTAFGKNQADLDALSAKLTDMMNNPHGFDAKTLALMRTTASDTVAQQTAQAQTAANTYLATHGGPELGTGVGAQIKGQIAGEGATEAARENSNIDIQNGLLQNENYWKAIEGLTSVANAENPTGIAGAETGSANATADLSRAYLSSKQADWQNTFGIINGIAGLGTAAVGGLQAAGVFGGAKAGGH